MRNKIKTLNIDIIHAHSRAASWVSYFAIMGTQAKLVSTIHGRQPLHASTKFFDIYGSKIICICKNIYDHLSKEVKIFPKKLVVIPNGLNFKSISNGKRQNTDIFTISLFGRTNGPKGKIIAELLKGVIPQLLYKFKNIQFQLAGGDIQSLGTEAIKNILEIERTYGKSRFVTLGFTNNLSHHILNSSLVIASGRIAMESLSLDIPTIALGEAMYHGLICNENFEDVVNSNFGDIAANYSKFLPDFFSILNDIETLLHSKNLNDNMQLSELIKQMYDVDKVAILVMKIYKELLIK